MVTMRVSQVVVELAQQGSSSELQASQLVLECSVAFVDVGVAPGGLFSQMALEVSLPFAAGTPPAAEETRGSLELAGLTGGAFRTVGLTGGLLEAEGATIE